MEKLDRWVAAFVALNDAAQDLMLGAVEDLLLEPEAQRQRAKLVLVPKNVGNIPLSSSTSSGHDCLAS